MKKAQFIQFATERGFDFSTAKARVQAYICGSTDLAVTLEDGKRNSRRVTFHITNKAAYAMRDRFNRWIAAEAARLADVAATVADESEYAETVMAEEAEAEGVEAFEVTVKGSVGVNNPFHAGDVVYVGAIEHMKATVTTLPKVGDVIEATGGIDNETNMVKVREVLNDCPPRPAHLQAAKDAWYAARFEGMFTEAYDLPENQARRDALDDMTSDQIYVAFAGAPSLEAQLMQDAWINSDDIGRAIALEDAHIEALAMNAEHDRLAVRDAVRHYVADEMARDFITPDCTLTTDPADKPKARRKSRIKVKAINNGKYTWRVTMQNGRTYLYTEGAQYAQLRVKSGNGHRYKEIKSSYMLARIQEIINSELSRKRA